jgi:hypothetical protein
MVRRALATVCGVGALVAPGVAAGQPQVNVGVQPGVAGVGEEGRYWQETRFFGALRGDVLLGRERDADPGVGPFVDLSTTGFSDVRLGTGASVLLPVSRRLPLVLSGGGYARHSEAGWEPGVLGWIFFGLRGHNFHSNYGAAGGLCVGLHQGVGSSRESAIVIAAHVDAVILMLPLVAGVEWLRH